MWLVGLELELYRTLEGDFFEIGDGVEGVGLGVGFSKKSGIVGKNRGENRGLGLLGGWGVSILDSPR